MIPQITLTAYYFDGFVLDIDSDKGQPFKKVSGTHFLAIKITVTIAQCEQHLREGTHYLQEGPIFWVGA